MIRHLITFSFLLMRKLALRNEEKSAWHTQRPHIL